MNIESAVSRKLAAGTKAHRIAFFPNAFELYRVTVTSTRKRKGDALQRLVVKPT